MIPEIPVMSWMTSEKHYPGALPKKRFIIKWKFKKINYTTIKIN